MKREQLNAIVFKNDTSRQITDAKHATHIANSTRATKSHDTDLAASVTRMSLSGDSSVNSGVIVTPDDTDAESVVSDLSSALLTPDSEDTHNLFSSEGGVILTPSGSTVSQSVSDWSFLGARQFTPNSSSANESTVDTPR